ncbi:hypothetical protein [Pontibaca methylaminivorans]|uniref:Uncharacterized protein n=1 Tax=Pontibaca methylaminivorans TaxID=515897 RepID=A0A1R3WZC5_9RHOB|nr:hypothetical protein [Pontibaca methylaminivorans]SIT83487.1 hypothetical protein SAMN05421849_1916 [Pontibaca methylaminivorans]
MSNRGKLEKENPGALAGATGAEHSSDAYSCSRSEYTPATGGSATDHVQPGHRRALHVLGLALALGDADAWAAFGALAARHLTETERAGLAFAALARLAPKQAERVAAAALDAAGAPLPAFLGDMAEARLWASLASRTERKAFALAAFESLDETDRASFLQHVSPRAAA